jgi:hypothetical protein
MDAAEVVVEGVSQVVSRQHNEEGADPIKGNFFEGL